LDWEREAQNPRNDRDDWVDDAQRWIAQIHGVMQCKIDLDPTGEVTGVHVVAGMDREPRHVVRDVESILKARLGLDVYYKKIGVVQVVGSEPGAAQPAPGTVTFHPPGQVTPESAPVSELSPPASGPVPEPVPLVKPVPDREPEADPPIPAVLLAEDWAPRMLCSGVGVMASDLTVRAEVHLRAGEVEARGTCEGPNQGGSDVTLVARAAIEAIGMLLAEPLILGLNEIRVRNLGGQSVVMTAVDLVEGRRSETLFGTCAAGHNLSLAVVHSVLDALNRRLTLYALKVEDTGA